VAQCVKAGLVEGTKIHADSSLVDANASLNSVRELDAATLDQIRQACREQTEKLNETEANKDKENHIQDLDLPPPGPKTEINQKYQSSIKPIPRSALRLSSPIASMALLRTTSAVKSENYARTWPICWPAARTGRTMRRHRDQKLLDRARRQANTKQAKLDRKRRQHLIERSFADASNLHGFKRARCED
jgi:hypothetical protein